MSGSGQGAELGRRLEQRPVSAVQSPGTSVDGPYHRRPPQVLSTGAMKGRFSRRIATASFALGHRFDRLRRTKATLIYRRTGNLRAVQLLLGHTKVESTVRYLGIEVDDALAIAEQIHV